MNSPQVISYAKKLFHILTVAALAISQLPTDVLPPKVAMWVALASSSISTALHFLTYFIPDAAKSEP